MIEGIDDSGVGGVHPWDIAYNGQTEAIEEEGGNGGPSEHVMGEGIKLLVQFFVHKRAVFQ